MDKKKIETEIWMMLLKFLGIMLSAGVILLWIL